MFEVLRDVSNSDHKRTCVRLSNGRIYCIDTADTFDYGPETMVFNCDTITGEVEYVNELYVAHYQSMEDAFDGHEWAVENIELIVKR